MPETFSGDPEGRRIARKRALLLSEAGLLAKALGVLLCRANHSLGPIEELIKDIKKSELTELQRSFGKISSRKKLKNRSGQPLLEGRPINCLFIDEAGESSPEPHVDTSYFTIAGVSMNQEDIDNYIIQADEIKREFFSRTDFPFHEPHLRRYSGKYYFDGDVGKQQSFDSAIEGLIKASKFQLFGAGIRKHAFREQFVETGIDPYLPTDVYMLAITMLLERYVDFLGYNTQNRRMGTVTFEAQGPKEDAYHQLEYARLLLEGSQWVSNSTFMDWLLPGLTFKPKQASHPLELSDMFARELYEWIQSDCTIEPKFWDLFTEKIYCRDDGARGQFGVKIFPDSDIRSLIEKHRNKRINTY